MTTIEPTITLADLVTSLPESARVLERAGLDYCCHGRRPLDEAARDAGVDVEALLAELSGKSAAAPAGPDWATMAPAQLIDHIVALHHDYLRSEIPRLAMLADKVATVHGPNHPELLRVNAIVKEFWAEMEPHLDVEEGKVFPAIRTWAEDPSGPRAAELVGPIAVLTSEHETVGELLEELTELTGSFVVPPDGCASYTALYAGLSEASSDTHIHVHKENNILFPAVTGSEAVTGG